MKTNIRKCIFINNNESVDLLIKHIDCLMYLCYHNYYHPVSYNTSIIHQIIRKRNV